jgi:hypothetical protein
MEYFQPEDLQLTYRVFRELYNQGEISRNEMEAITREFIFFDDDGHIWVPGANTGNWFVKTNDSWIEANPPGLLFQAYLETIEEEKTSNDKLKSKKIKLDLKNPILKELLKHT